MPFRQDAFVAIGANMAESRVGVEAVFIAAAPGAQHHALCYRFPAIYASESRRDYPVVPLEEGAAALFAPVELLSVAGFENEAGLEVLRHVLEHRREHLLGVCKTLARIHLEGLLEESYECQIGSLAKPFMPLGWPVKRPFRQEAGEIFV